MSEEGSTGDEGAPEAARPEYVPEKFWNEESKEVNLEGVFKSYGELESKIGQKEEAIRESLEADFNKTRMDGVPDTLEGYEYKAPTLENAPEGWDIEVNEDDPLLGWWKETAFNQKLTQDQYQDGIQKYFEMTFNPANKEKELAELGENGQERVDAVDGWVANNFTEEEYAVVAELASSAAGIAVLEKFIGMTGEPDLASFGSQAPAGNVDEAKLEEMMNDPRYWKAGSIDEGYRARVTEMFQKAYG